MANFKSKAYRGGVKFRPLYEQAFELETTVRIPAGRTVADGDVFKFSKIGANVDVLEVFVRCDKLEDGAGTASTLDVGTLAVPDCFIDGSTTLTRTVGGMTVKVENGGDDPFADQPYVVLATGTELQATFLGTATQTTADDADRFITLRAVMQYKTVPTPENVTNGVGGDVYSGGGLNGYGTGGVSTPP